MGYFFTELYDPEKDVTDLKRSFIIKTQEPFKEFRKKVYQTHMALHPCEIIDREGKVSKITETSLPWEYLWVNSIILTWQTEKPFDAEMAMASFEVILERITKRERETKEFFGATE